MRLYRDSNGQLSSYAWPGGYPIYYLDGESGVLCPKCANKEQSVEKFEPVAAGM